MMIIMQALLKMAIELSPVIIICGYCLIELHQDEKNA